MKQQANSLDKPFPDKIAYTFWLKEQAKILLPEVEKEVKLWVAAQPSSSIRLGSYVAAFHEELQECISKFVDKLDTFLFSKKTESYVSILKYSETLSSIYVDRLSLKKRLENDRMILFSLNEFLPACYPFSQGEIFFLKDNPTILGALTKKVLAADLFEQCFTYLWDNPNFGLIEKKLFKPL